MFQHVMPANAATKKIRTPLGPENPSALPERATYAAPVSIQKTASRGLFFICDPDLILIAAAVSRPLIMRQNLWWVR